MAMKLPTKLVFKDNVALAHWQLGCNGLKPPVYSGFTYPIGANDAE